MENLSEGPRAQSIKTESRVYSAAGAGTIPFVSCGDIAAVTVSVLTDTRDPNKELEQSNWNRDYLVTGPALCTYDEVAELIGGALGRKIEHVRLTGEEMAQRYVDMGGSAAYAGILANIEVETGNGGGDKVSGDVKEATGREPVDFGSWL